MQSRFDLLLQSLKDEHHREVAQLKLNLFRQQGISVVDFGDAPSMTTAMSGEKEQTSQPVRRLHGSECTSPREHQRPSWDTSLRDRPSWDTSLRERPSWECSLDAEKSVERTSVFSMMQQPSSPVGHSPSMGHTPSVSFVQTPSMRMTDLEHKVLRKAGSTASGMSHVYSLRRNSTASRQSLIQLRRMQSTSQNALPLGETPRFSDALKNLDETPSEEVQPGLRSRRVLLEGSSLFEKVIKDTKFDLFFSLLILLNACAFAIQVQLKGWDNGSKEGLTSVDHAFSDHPTWGPTLDFLKGVGNVIGALFFVEVVLKLIGLGLKRYARSFWNWFDALIVASWLLEDVAGGMSLPISGRALRSLRLLRLLRVLRLLRTIQLCDSLYLLNAAFKGSIGVLFWSLLYLAVVQITLALMLCEGVHAYYLNDLSHPLEHRQDVFDYFGTTSRATMTMFEMTLANWAPVCRLMAARVGEWWVVFALVHKLTLGFAFIGIINGVVLQETFKAAAQDSNVMLRDRLRSRERVGNDLRRVFNSANARKDGNLTIDEFVKMCDDPVLQLWLSAIGLSTKDATKVFYLIDDGDGKITADELVEGVDRFRGVASGIDLHLLVYDMDERVHKMFEEQAMQLNHFQHKLSVLQGRVEAQAEFYGRIEDEQTLEV